MAAPRIEWQESSRVLVAEHATYARMARMKSGEILCAYERRGQCQIKRSTDEGKTWQGENTITNYREGRASNPELLVRRNGEVWLLFNERPQKAGQPFAISYHISKDEGRTWSEVKRLFTAGTTREDGCWEPVAMEYPDGEIQVFFANEAPYRKSNEQEISFISSRDPDKVITASFRAGARDGMPVPCLLDDGRTLVMAIEDSGLNGSMKPVILRSTVKDRWREGVIAADSPRRHRALAEPLDANVYAGAPYLVSLPDGLTVLSVQSDEDREKPEMVVYLGNREAREFGDKSSPFQLPTGVAGQWNSLFVKNRTTVTALSGTTIDGVGGVWAIDGHIHP